MSHFKTFNEVEAKEIGESIGIDFNQIKLDEFRAGLTVELEHGSHDKDTNVTNDDYKPTGKIAWAHLKEIPNYYSWLELMENTAEKKITASEASKKVFELAGEKTEGTINVYGSDINKVWFKAKRYGYGWVPASKEGWLVIVIWLVLVAREAVDTARFDMTTSNSSSDTLIRFAWPFALITILFLMLCYAKGEKPRWRWGK